MSERWWKRKGRSWFDIFDEFDRLEKAIDEMMHKTFETPSKRAHRPYVYGFSMSVGSNGKPVIREFGNGEHGHSGPEIREEREPLVDVMEEEKDVLVVAELPGVEKEDINLRTTDSHLLISVDTPRRKYHKELQLPTRVESNSGKASYKHGVLEVRLKKL